MVEVTRINPETDTPVHPVVAIHQPNFCPWAGYFNKMFQADIFIYLDTAPYTVNSFQNRNRIMTSQGVKWLTVPVLTKGKSGALTKEIEINRQIPWERKHLKTLRLNYGKAGCFKDIFGEIERIYSHSGNLLADFNIKLLSCIASILRIETPTVRSSELPEKGMATQRLISLIKSVGGKTYLSGIGGRKYLDEALFRANDIQLVYQNFNPAAYPHLGATPGLSILDTLFYMGGNAETVVKGGRSGDK